MAQTVEKATSTSEAVAIRSVRKAFGARAVLNGIDLAMPGGQAVCLCGINGAGKSTLLRVVAGLLRPDEGSVQVNGFDLRQQTETAKRQLGMISHASMVYPELTALENLTFATRLYGLRDGADRAERLLVDVGLVAYRHDRAGILSRGLLQRLAIARALIHGPAVLLADEAFTGLDADACERLVAIFHRFVADGGTILMTTHDTRLGLRCCHRVVVLDKGKIALDSPTESVDATAFSDDYLAYARGAS
jgi:heme exporter protein A